ncbi:MAG: hypothetical protein JNL61_22265 [Rhizobiaceae bacterium]|nr:hypothetical protein [Rhizobiaceae bacterium]
MTRILGIACALQFAALAFGGWLLWGQIEKSAKLEQSVEALTKANEAKSNATRSRAKTEQDTRRMAPADKRNWLLGKPADPER